MQRRALHGRVEAPKTVHRRAVVLRYGPAGVSTFDFVRAAVLRAGRGRRSDKGWVEESDDEEEEGTDNEEEREKCPVSFLRSGVVSDFVL